MSVAGVDCGGKYTVRPRCDRSQLGLLPVAWASHLSFLSFILLTAGWWPVVGNDDHVIFSQ